MRAGSGISFRSRHLLLITSMYLIRLQTLQDQESAQEARLEELYQAVAEVTRQQEQLRAENDALQQEKSVLEETKASTIQRLRKERDGLQISHKRLKASEWQLQEEMKIVRGEKALLLEEIARHKQELATSRKAVRQAKDLQKRTAEELMDLRESIAVFQGEADELRAQLEAMEEK